MSSNIETLQEICVKFGGLPSFDVFRENFYKDEAEEKIMTDPKNPEEDNKSKYQWRRVRATGPSSAVHPLANARVGLVVQLLLWKKVIVVILTIIIVEIGILRMSKKLKIHFIYQIK